MALKFRVELVWEGEKETASSIYLTGDGRVVLQGRAISPQERAAMSLPPARCRLTFSSSRHMPIKLRALIDFLRRDARQAAPRRARQPDRSPDRSIAADAVRSVARDVAAPTHAAVRSVRPGDATLEARPAA